MAGPRLEGRCPSVRPQTTEEQTPTAPITIQKLETMVSDPPWALSMATTKVVQPA